MLSQRECVTKVQVDLPAFKVMADTHRAKPYVTGSLDTKP